MKFSYLNDIDFTNTNVGEVLKVKKAGNMFMKN